MLGREVEVGDSNDTGLAGEMVVLIPSGQADASIKSGGLAQTFLVKCLDRIRIYCGRRRVGVRSIRRQDGGIGPSTSISLVRFQGVLYILLLPAGPKAASHRFLRVS